MLAHSDALRQRSQPQSLDSRRHCIVRGAREDRLSESAMSSVQLRAIETEVVACTKCRELRRYCMQVAQTKKREHRDATYWGKPVPGFGGPRARVVLVGLAPGAHGSNRTGRVFTG